MPFTWAQFIVAFPQFANLPTGSATLTSLLGWIINDVSQTKFGPDYVRALMLLAAHWFVLLGREGSGAVTAERVGDLSRSYAAPSGNSTLDSTEYGKMFRLLARRKVGSIHFRGQSYPAVLADYRPEP